MIGKCNERYGFKASRRLAAMKSFFPLGSLPIGFAALFSKTIMVAISPLVGNDCGIGANEMN